ncbi:MAG: Flp pilus assembly protein CpaB, partial [Geminicoccaceae bacterium]
MILRFILVIALMVTAAGLGFIAWQSFLPPATETVIAVDAAAPMPPPVLVRMLVAAQALPIATLLKDGDLVAREVAQTELPEGAVLESDEARAEVRGAMLRRYLDSGAPILRTDVLRLRDRGFLAAVLRPGTRAITIAVDAVTGAGGLIWPGDQVDLILTQEIEAATPGQAKRFAGETILTDLRVIAVDQKIAQGRSDTEEERKLAQTVTLEVEPAQAERVAVAARLGNIA